MIDYVKDLKDGFRPTLLAYQDGQRAGERASERRGHEQGPQEGYDNGYDNGYADGQADMANTRDRVAELEDGSNRQTIERKGAFTTVSAARLMLDDLALENHDIPESMVFKPWNSLLERIFVNARTKIQCSPSKIPRQPNSWTKCMPKLPA